MTDYNWKSCADPANAARLRELLDGTRDIILRIVGVKGLVNIRATRHCWGFTDAVSFLDPDEPSPIRPHTCECVCGCIEPTNDELCADCHVRNIRGDKCQTMRARILGLEYGV